MKTLESLATLDWKVRLSITGRSSHYIARAVALELFALPKKFRRDPTDRIIVATARALNLPLLTYDQRIRKSGLVKVWKPG